PATSYEVECFRPNCLLIHGPVLIPSVCLFPSLLPIASRISLCHSTTSCPLLPLSLTMFFVIVVLVYCLLHAIIIRQLLLSCFATLSWSLPYFWYARIVIFLFCVLLRTM
uniref:Uncharacterized protein n=1 Tax=Aegilops tauschii subsp. strangulata TaxID=200361 RepID=A0A453QBH5_AEGTS